MGWRGKESVCLMERTVSPFFFRSRCRGGRDPPRATVHVPATLMRLVRCFTLVRTHTTRDSTQNCRRRRRSSSPFTMALDFKEPAWAVAPPTTDSWTLLEIKSGVEVADYKLDNACTLFGRAVDKPNIQLNHESCSRLHARIAFDSTGVPWLRDLGSSHGTSVNKRKLPAAAVGKVESNSTKRGTRGVTLFPGDMIQFGASTRMYCLEGPAEYERGAVRKIVPSTESTTAESHLAAAAAKTHEAAEDNGINWGMADHNVNESHDAEVLEASSQPLDPNMIPDKHRKLFERLRAKQYKLENVQRESDRIRSKGTDLTQGQEAQLAKNDSRIQHWEKEISELEQELRNKLYPEKSKSLHHEHKQKTQSEDEDEEDDSSFYDRTKGNQNDLFEDGETQESLIRKWKELLREWKSCGSSLLTKRQEVDRLEARLKAAADQNDEDAFFLQNDLSLAKDSLNKAEERKEEIAHNLHETERLLHVVSPRLEYNRETGVIGVPGEEKEETSSATDGSDDSAMMPPPVSASSPMAPKQTMSPAASLPPPLRMPPPMNDMLPPPIQATGDAMPPPKRARIFGPTMPPPSAARELSTLAVDEMEMPPPAASKQSSRAPPIGTLSVLAARKRDGHHQHHHSPSKHKKEPSGSPQRSEFDPKKDVWKAPEDQDGSGRTKLNKKFEGRY